MSVHVSASGEKRRQRRYQDLFFLRRRPRRNIPIEWERPADDADYQKLLDQEGFIARELWGARYGDSFEQHPVIMQDIEDLDQHLLPTFFQINQKAKYYQNVFYTYQWIFVCGAFLTTLFGTMAAFTANPEATGLESLLSRGLSICTAIVGAVTAYFTALSNRGRPQERWAKTRSLAEELRTEYFRYLSHLPPYDKPDRVQRLRANVVEMRVKEQENQGTA
jgi:hypothetical protein